MKIKSRREFISNSTRAIAAASIMVQVIDPGRSTDKVSFIHQVYFWLKDPGSTEDSGKLVKGLQTLTKIKGIRMHHIGKPAGTSREVIDGTFSVSWLLIFDNAADQDSYQTDPIHLQFIKDCSELWSKVIVYDSIDA